MRVVLATGIYPPDIGGPATYVQGLSEALRRKGTDVTILTYGEAQPGDDEKRVTRVPRSGGPIMRYIRYASALRKLAAHADIVEAFSSVSCGIPLWLSHLKHPKKILRLGGDFLWERATDRGSTQSLTEWYRHRPMNTSMMNGLLRTFHVLVFSTHFQEDLYRRVYKNLPQTAVVENVAPEGHPTVHALHDPMRLLFLGRFVAFKNIPAILEAMKFLPKTVLTIAGSGPLESFLKRTASSLGLRDRVTFLPRQNALEREALFREHDLLVLPSRTEISPNTALEARAAGLPVLLTEETGLSRTLQDGMVLQHLVTAADVVHGIESVTAKYETIARRGSEPLPDRTWDSVADEHLSLFLSVL